MWQGQSAACSCERATENCDGAAFNVREQLVHFACKQAAGFHVICHGAGDSVASDSTGNRAAGSCGSASRGELNERAVGGELSVGAPVRERVVVNLLGCSNKQAAGWDSSNGQQRRAVGSDGSYVEPVQSCYVRCKQRRRCCVPYELYSKLVSES